jgi:hypothetical protein
MMMGWEYEEQCLVDGELSDKLAKNGTTDGVIITVQSKLDLDTESAGKLNTLQGKILNINYMLLVYAG